MRARVLQSTHASLNKGMVGRILKPLKDDKTGREGFEVLFDEVKVIHYSSPAGTKQAAIVWLAQEDVELLEDVEEGMLPVPHESIEATPVQEAPKTAELEVMPKLSCICCDANPLLQVVLCQLPKGHKGKHRAEVTILAKEQTFIWE